MSLPRLHLITDTALATAPTFAPMARRLLQRFGPAVALHLRMPGAAGAMVYACAEELRPAALASGARFIVNDRIDIAMAVRADGVQLGGGSIPVARARALVGNAWIGASLHSAAETAEARAAGIDFVLLGTIHPSPSHPGGRVLGAEVLDAVTAAGVPVLGIGGMTPERAADAVKRGAYGVAVISGVWGAAEPERAAAEFLDALGVEHE